MSGGLNIAELKGTPLYALAKNANIYGGRDLSKTEMVFFRQQCQEMGFEPAKYGLEIESEDMEGASTKETRRNSEELEDLVKDAYKGQFGKKGIEPAKMAETKAYAMVKVAKEAFEKNHKGAMFTPESLGTKPNFKEPKYKDNLTEYAVDLNAWAKDVCTQYNDADHMSNEQLTELILANNNKNTESLNDTINAASQNIVEKVVDQGDLTRQAVHNEGNATRQAVHYEGNATRQAVQNEGNAIIKKVVQQGVKTRIKLDDAAADINNNINQNGKKTREENKLEHEKTRKQVVKEVNQAVDNLDPTGLKRAAKKVRDQAKGAVRDGLNYVKDRLNEAQRRLK